MANCFTCGEQITFNKNILSKTGKQIPLWPDQRDAHGHDKDTGKPIRQPLPNQGLNEQQTQQFNQYNRRGGPETVPAPGFESTYQQQPKTREQKYEDISRSSSGFQATGYSQGGSYMDTKRLRVMVEELQKLLNVLDEKIEACYQLAKSNNIMLGELIQYFKINDPKSAKELYEAMDNTKREALKPEPEVKGWNSVPNSTNKTKTAIVDESKDFPVEETLKDDDDDDLDDDEQNNNKGVIDDL